MPIHYSYHLATCECSRSGKITMFCHFLSPSGNSYQRHLLVFNLICLSSLSRGAHFFCHFIFENSFENQGFPKIYARSWMREASLQVAVGGQSNRCTNDQELGQGPNSCNAEWVLEAKIYLCQLHRSSYLRGYV